MNRFKVIGVALVGFGAILSIFSYFIIASIPLTALGLAFAVLGCVVLIFPEYLVLLVYLAEPFNSSGSLIEELFLIFFYSLPGS